MSRAWQPCKIYRKPDGGDVLFTQHRITRELRKEPLEVLNKFAGLRKADLPVYRENPKYLEYFDRIQRRWVSRWPQVGDVVHLRELEFGECVAERGMKGGEPFVEVASRANGNEVIAAKTLTVVHHNIIGMGTTDHEDLVKECSLPIETPEELAYAERLLHQRALNWVLDQSQSVEIDISFVREVHRQLMEPLFSWAGEYRTQACFVGRKDWQTTSPRFIPAQMKSFQELLDEVLVELQELNESQRRFWLNLGKIYFELCRIHPFQDGNGRVSRLVLVAFIGREAMEPAPLDWGSLGRAANQTDRAFEAARERNDLRPLTWLIRKAYQRGREAG